MALDTFFYDSTAIRTAGTIVNPLFCLSDACGILHIANMHNKAAKLCSLKRKPDDELASLKLKAIMMCTEEAKAIHVRGDGWRAGRRRQCVNTKQDPYLIYVHEDLRRGGSALLLPIAFTACEHCPDGRAVNGPATS